MKKLNGFESYLVVEGLNKLALEMKAEIRAAEEVGKRPLMTTGYVDMVVNDALEKITSFTVKQKK
jgi:O-acetylhomoserine/O-acetylserine sulfhydrylase-like pyridoxal-dependent enzyme